MASAMNRAQRGRIITEITVFCEVCGKGNAWEKWLGDGRRGRLSASKVAEWIRKDGWFIKDGRWRCPKERNA